MIDSKPLGAGGYAEVFGATRKTDGFRVAFKRLKRQSDPSHSGRMSREIDVLRQLAGHQNVMPVLDADEDGKWYVMPLARGDLVKLRPAHPSDGKIVSILSEVINGLEAAHELDLLHRDLTPRNILQLDEAWVVADWGMVRRPLGETTHQWTQTDQAIGTEGFAAPELRGNAHGGAEPRSDVYSLGRVLGWLVSGAWPIAGDRALPPGTFRRLVADSTRAIPSARPSLSEFRSRLREAIESDPGDLEDEAAALAERCRAGEADAPRELLELATTHSDEFAIYFDCLPDMRRSSLRDLVAESEDQVLETLASMEEHLLANDGRWGERNYDRLNDPLEWIENVARAAESVGNEGVLEDALTALFRCEPKLNRYAQRHRTRSYLEQMPEKTAMIAVRAIRGNDEAIGWYCEEDWRPRGTAARSIRRVLRSPPP